MTDEYCLPPDNEIGKYLSYLDSCTFSGGYLRKETDKGTIVISNFLPVPVEDIHLDDGNEQQRFFKIKGLKYDGERITELPTVTVKAGEAAAMNWVTENWGFVANIESPIQSRKDTLRSIMFRLGERFAIQKTIYTHIGWRELNSSWFYLHGGGAIGAENIEVQLDNRMNRFDLSGEKINFISVCNAVSELFGVALPEIIYPAISLVFLSPLNEFLRQAGYEPSFVLYYLGRTQSHKSTFAALMLSFFGKFTATSLPSSFKDTANAIERKGYMTFGDFVDIYRKDMKNRIREHTWQMKNNIINNKLLPYFKYKKISSIAPKDVIAWQNEMMDYRDDKGEPYSPVYLKTIHNQLSAIFNHAVRFYGLSCNPAVKAGNMGREKCKEMKFWTKEEYLKFADSMMDKPLSFYAFEMLYWCGVRLGELLALTKDDFDFQKSTVSITKSYQYLNKRDVITEPKTPKSNRVISMPDFLCEEMDEYIRSLYGIKNNDRLFTISKSYLHHEMTRGSTEQGIQRIRLHDLRHSHVSLLIEMGFSAVAIADRVGHESIDITYRYAHLFPTKQAEIANKLNFERIESNVRETIGPEKPMEEQNGILPNVTRGGGSARQVG